MKCILEFLNSASISALIGAFAAFMLVMFTDYIRSRKVKTDIKKLLRSDQKLLKDKKSAITRYKEALDHDSLQGDRLTPFSFEEIRQLKLSSIKRFSEKELVVIQSICFHMESQDKMITDAANQAELIRQNPNGNHGSKLDYIERLYKDLIPNLGRLDEMIEDYLNKDFKKIIEKKYIQENYETS